MLLFPEMNLRFLLSGPDRTGSRDICVPFHFRACPISRTGKKIKEMYHYIALSLSRSLGLFPWYIEYSLFLVSINDDHSICTSESICFYYDEYPFLEARLVRFYLFFLPLGTISKIGTTLGISPPSRNRSSGRKSKIALLYSIHE